MATNFEEMLTDVFGAVDKIVDVRLQNLDFDKSILCDIIDNKNSGKGEYVVSDGVTRFFAYSKDDTYSIGDSVYVSIPNNDFNNQKNIIGKHIRETDSPYDYISPMESFLKATNNYVTLKENQYGIIANGNIGEKDIWEWKKDENDKEIQGYDKVGISAKFKTWLKDLDVVSGSYGLRLYLKTKKGVELNQVFKNQIKETQEKTIADFKDADEKLLAGEIHQDDYKNITLALQETYNETVKEIEDEYNKNVVNDIILLELDSSLMYGNVYNYISPTLQEGVFDISDLEDISEMKLTLYQKKDFLISTGNKLTYNSLNVLENIFVSDINISFGYNVEKFTDGEVILSSSKSLNYSYEDATRKKDLIVRWFLNKNQIIDTEEEFLALPNAKIHWYQYHLSDYLDKNSQDIQQKNWFKMYKPVLVNEDDFNLNKDKYFKLKGLYEYEKADSFDNFLFEPYIGLTIPEVILNENNDFEKFQVIIEYPTREFQYEKYLIDENHLQNEKLLNFLEKEETFEELLKDEEERKGLMDLFPNRDPSIEFTYDYFIELLSKIYNCQNSKAYIRSRIESEDSSLKNTILSDVKYYKSNELNFINLNTVIDDTTSKFLNGINLKIDEKGYNGIYFLYDEKNKINVYAETQTVRVAEADTSQLELDGFLTTDHCWYIPIKNTMIDNANKDFSYVTLNIQNGKNIFTECQDENQATHYLIKDKIANFTIKDKYNINYTNNTLYFQLNKNGTIYEQSTLLSFGPKGSQGVEYTFQLIPSRKQPLNINNKDDFIYLTPKLLDSTGKNIDFTNFSTALIGGNDSIKINVESNKIKVFFNNDFNINEIKPVIVEVSIKGIKISNLNNKNLNFFAYYPITITNFQEEIFYYGTTEVMYNSMGGSPDYYSDEHKILSIDGTELSNSWEIIPLTKETISFNPKFNGKYLQVPNLYIENLGIFYIQAKGPNDFIFLHPLRFYQDTYNSTMLNAWDGTTSVNESEGTIFSSVIGAGKKNDKNNFDGVLLGNVNQTTNEDNPFYYSGIGLYGYNDGIKTFGFNVHGTAFLGKAGRGQILFDGNNGVIQSANFIKNNIGMRIDLDNGILTCLGRKIPVPNTNKTTQAGIQINPNPNQNVNQVDENGLGNGYFIIQNNEGKNLFFVSDTEYYLKTASFNSITYAQQEVSISTLYTYENKVLKREGTSLVTFKVNSKTDSSSSLPAEDGDDGDEMSTIIYTVGMNRTNSNFTVKDYKYQISGIDTATVAIYNLTKGYKIGDISVDNEGNLHWTINSTQKEYTTTSTMAPNAVSKGTKIDLKDGKIEAYSFVLNAKSNNGGIILQSEGIAPFQILNSGGAPVISFGWGGDITTNGSIKANSFNAQTGNITTFTANSFTTTNAIINGTLTINALKRGDDYFYGYGASPKIIDADYYFYVAKCTPHLSRAQLTKSDGNMMSPVSREKIKGQKVHYFWKRCIVMLCDNPNSVYPV